MSKLFQVLRRLVPRAVAKDLVDQNPAFIAQQVRTYMEGDDATKADIRAFHESDGVGKIRTADAVLHGCPHGCVPVSSCAECASVCGCSPPGSCPSCRPEEGRGSG